MDVGHPIGRMIALVTLQQEVALVDISSSLVDRRRWSAFLAFIHTIELDGS